MGILAGYHDPIVIADNGSIDLLVNTGYTELALFLIFYLVVWSRAIKSAWNALDVYGLFPLAVMTYTLFANVSWTLIFEDESLMLLIMIPVMFLMLSGRAVQREQTARERAHRTSVAVQP